MWKVKLPKAVWARYPSLAIALIFRRCACSGRIVAYSENIVGMQALPPGRRPHVRVVARP